jgi:hypothetical protein
MPKNARAMLAMQIAAAVESLIAERAKSRSAIKTMAMMTGLMP